MIFFFFFNPKAILGKKYPTTQEEFSKLKLLGVFDESLAGKRMKLPTPITWETQLAERVNCYCIRFPYPPLF